MSEPSVTLRKRDKKKQEKDKNPKPSRPRDDLFAEPGMRRRCGYCAREVTKKSWEKHWAKEHQVKCKRDRVALSNNLIAYHPYWVDLPDQGTPLADPIYCQSMAYRTYKWLPGRQMWPFFRDKAMMRVEEHLRNGKRMPFLFLELASAAGT